MQVLEVNTGDTVRLPCLVDRLEGFVMLWKKKDNILTVAEQIIDKVASRAGDMIVKLPLVIGFS